MHVNNKSCKEKTYLSFTHSIVCIKVWNFHTNLIQQPVVFFTKDDRLLHQSNIKFSNFNANKEVGLSVRYVILNKSCKCLYI